MNYRVRTEYKNGTIEFYYTFDDYDFIKFLSEKKNLKNEVGALSFAISQNMRTIRVIMPIGTSENDFNEKMRKFFQKNMDMLSLHKQFKSYDGNKSMDDFASVFGNIFGWR